MTLERDHDDPILQLLDGLAEATAMLDADGTVLVANEACAGRLGRARHEILGRRIDDLLPANAHRRRPFVAAARSGVSVRFRDERDGRWLEQRVVPLRDGDGAVYRFAVYCADVTEQRTGEREHAARSAELEAIHAHSPVAVLILDPERNITQANAAAARMTGRGRAEVIGRVGGAGIGCLNSLDDPRGCGFGPSCVTCELRAAIRSAFADGVVVDGLPVALPMASPEGRATRHVLVSAAPVELAAGRHVVVSLQDITRLRESERRVRMVEGQLHQSQKMDALGRLAAGVAHDFNNQLTVIAGYCEMLLEATPADAPLRAAMEQIRRATERASSTAGHLLAFSRQREMSPREIDLNTVLRDMLHPVGKLIGEAVAVRTELSPRLRSVRVDPGALQQAVFNLILNSRDAMPDGGRIVLRTANAPGADGAVTVALTVEDTGCGIDPAHLQHVCEPFFTTKEAGRGTGLGLAMVKGFVEQSGGDLAIRSLPLAGTAITLTLPAAPIAATPAEADEGDAEVGDLRGRFLVVEDEDEVRALVVDVLRQHRAEVTASSSAGAALAAAAATGPFDVLITDLVMPGMRGDELASRLTSQGRVRQVVFMSGYHDARPEPPDGAVLAKPFAVRDLVRAARAALAATGRPDVAKELIPA